MMQMTTPAVKPNNLQGALPGDPWDPDKEIDRTLAHLNDLLISTGVTPYKLALVKPTEIVLLDKNAHYMPKRVFDQLVANIKRDHNLESLPFCWRRDDGKFVALSGNHRVKGAIEANVSLIMVLYTDAPLLADERVAKQIAHNALVGMDNPTMLAELYQSIGDLNFKIYSGLDDETLKTLQKVDVRTLREANLLFEEIVLTFVPAEQKQIELVVKEIGRHRKALTLVGDYRDWDEFFETLLRFKEQQRIVNSATAFKAMIEIVRKWMEEHDGQSNSDAEQISRTGETVAQMVGPGAPGV